MCSVYVTEAGSLEPSWTLARQPREASERDWGVGDGMCTRGALPLQFGWVVHFEFERQSRFLALEVAQCVRGPCLWIRLLMERIAFWPLKSASVRVVLTFHVCLLFFYR